MDKFVEFCQETSQCMQNPQQDSAGWLLWIIWIGGLLLVIGGFIGSVQARKFLLNVLRNPSEYRGRMGKEEFLLVYYPLQILRCTTILAIILTTAILSHSRWVYLPLVLGTCLLLWASVALYCAVIRRGHDFGFKAKESIKAYVFSAPFLIFLNRRNDFAADQLHTWSVLRSQKGSPFANLYGSAPAENNYLLAGRMEETRFPSVWDEADWNQTKK